jgi:hypothetical protein
LGDDFCVFEVEDFFGFQLSFPCVYFLFLNRLSFSILQTKLNPASISSLASLVGGYFADEVAVLEGHELSVDKVFLMLLCPMRRMT